MAGEDGMIGDYCKYGALVLSGSVASMFNKMFTSHQLIKAYI